MVLTCGLLLAADLFMFHAISSSEYSQVRRLVKGSQSSALADIASDEVYLQVDEIGDAVADRKQSLPDWANVLLDKLEAARSAAQGQLAAGLDVTIDEDIREKLQATLDAAGEAGGGLVISSARLRAGPFRSLPGGYDPRYFYSEPTFKDGEKDLVPWDLRGPVTVDVTVAIQKGPFAFDQRYIRTQDLTLIDTTPPAAEFALMSFLPPPDEDYALNDLQRGGRMTIFPFDAGRVMVRGPALLVAEDAPKDKPFLGGKRRDEGAINYPTPNDRRWIGWGSVPGPRALQYPFGDLLTQLKHDLNFLLNLFGVDPLFSDLGPRRPRTAESPPWTLGPIRIPLPPPANLLKSHVTFGPWTINVSFLLGVGIERLASIYLPLNDDEISYFSPGAYFYGPLEQGKQTFSILGSPDFLPQGAGGITSVSMYRGANLTPDLSSSTDYDKGLKGLSTTTGKEAQAILPEPVPQIKGDGLADIGLIGYYQAAAFDISTWFSISALELLGPMLCSAVGPGGTVTCKLITDALSYLGLDASPRMMVRYYETLTKEPPERDFSMSEVEKQVEKHEAMITPYGLFMHNDNFWSGDNAKQAASEWAFNTIANAVFKFGVTKLFKFVDKILAGASAKALKEAAEAEGAAVAKETAEAIAITAVKEITEEVAEPILKLMAKSFTGQYFAKLLIGRLKPFVTKPITGLRNKVFSTWPPETPEELAAVFASVGQDPSAFFTEYPKGFFPPKYREFERIVTRSYPDMASYLAAESKDGVLQLRGAVLVRSLDYRGGPIRYRGRGILVATTTDQSKPAVLDAIVEPELAPVESHLTLAHRVLDTAARNSQSMPPLRLGQKFVGSVYSDTGVAPAGQATLVLGNVVTGLINKRAIDRSLTGKNEGLFVRYRPELAKAAAGSRVDYWSLDLVGEVSSAADDTEKK